MPESDEAGLPVGYEVAVAMAAARGPSPRPPFPADGADAGPGFDETSGWRRAGHAAEVVLAKGDAAVKLATESIARQIALAASRIAAAVDGQSAAASPGSLSLESVEVSFGVTLSAGVEALFTAKSESSVEVTIILTRKPA